MASDKCQEISKVYAKALFELAVEQGVTEDVRNELKSISVLVGAEPQWRVFLENPAIHVTDKGQVIHKVFKGRVSELAMDFLGVLARRNRLMVLPEVNASYCALEDAHAGRLKGKVVTAIEMDDKEHARMTEQIGRALRKKVILEKECDPSILGGMVLTIEGKVVDGSLRGDLDQVVNQLKGKAFQDIGGMNLIDS